MSKIPEDLRFAESHEWVREENGTVRIGISDNAQEQLGDLVYVELPEVGTAFSSGDPCAVVESVKAASDLYCPISGEVVEVNETLDGSPEIINDDPYGEGWIFVLKPTEPGEVESLMSAEAYGEMLEE